ncbi:hypothetical protein DPX16_0768 [Anabarilius grahami]|uniref:Uncharacterized protein n=1 Tax=Anabarilius grahami TaxID=495550 RepID=A0A3N0XZL6_ANAGA|nr:hypothetical protein DPX16_0768 [Anabarilius grahami]
MFKAVHIPFPVRHEPLSLHTQLPCMHMLSWRRQVLCPHIFKLAVHNGNYFHLHVFVLPPRKYPSSQEVARVCYTVHVVNTVQHFLVLRQNAGSLLASSCIIIITHMRHDAHMNSVGQY